MSKRYNTILDIILIIGFISYAIAHALGMENFKISFILAFLLLNAALQVLVGFLFRKKTETDTDEIKESKIERILYRIILVFSLFYLFCLGFVICDFFKYFLNLRID